LYLDERYTSFDALFTWGGRPFCRCDIRPDQDSRTIATKRIAAALSVEGAWPLWIRAISDGLAHAAPEHPLPPVSVLVCTRDRPHSLAKCLESLRQLDYPAYDVTVVDNCSRNQEIARIIIEGSGFTYVHEGRPGLDWARNRGIQESRHELIAFIDDDACASPGWLRALAHAFAAPDVMAVTGLILPAEIETRNQRLFECYGGMSKGLRACTYRPEHMSGLEMLVTQQFGAGANMAFRRRLFDTVGLFDTALDTGTASGGCGDLDMFHRVLAAGFTLRYQPDAWILHTHRRDFDGLCHQIYSNGRSHGVYIIKRLMEGSVSRSEVLRYALYWFWGWVCSRLVRRVFRKHSECPRSLLWAEFRGALSAPWAFYATYRNDRTLRRRLEAAGRV
jgi:GT2 family glycosyltransferase